MSKETSVAIFGAGPGALSVAENLTGKGFTVRNFFSGEHEPSRRSVLTTTVGYPGLALTDVCPPDVMRPVDEMRMVTTKGNEFTASLDDCYFMVDYPAFINGVSQNLGTRPNYIPEVFPADKLISTAVNEKNGVVEVRLDGGKQEFDFVIDATGPKARIARQVEERRKNENPVVEYVFGGQFKGHLDRNQMILVVGVNGGTCWINPSVYDDKQIDIVFSAWGWMSFWDDFVKEGHIRLQKLAEFAKTISGLHLESTEPDSTFSGMIRSQSIPVPAARHTFTIGEAAGIAKPGTGESFNRTIYSGGIIAQAINDGKYPWYVHRKLARENKDYRTAYAAILARMPYQSIGQIGGVFNEFASKYGNSLLKQDDTEIFENYFIRGRLHPKIIGFMLNSPSCRKFLLEIFTKRVRMALNGDDLDTPFYSLPQI